MWWRLAGLFIIALVLPARASAQTDTGIRIDAPASGAVLRGVIEVIGTSAADGFFNSELSFAYAEDLTSWFPIASIDQPVSDALLAVWDTNNITDGNYVLRLHVGLQNGSVVETFVTGLQIRNQTSAETATPEPTQTAVPLVTFAPPLAQTEVPTLSVQNLLPTPTPFAPNPAAVTPAKMTASLQRGLILAFLSFILIGILLRFRRV